MAGGAAIAKDLNAPAVSFPLWKADRGHVESS